MKNSIFDHKILYYSFMMLILSLLACGTFHIGLEDSLNGAATPTLDATTEPGAGVIIVPTSGPDLKATIDALATQNRQLISRIETLVATSTDTPTPQTLTAQSTLTSTPTTLSSARAITVTSTIPLPSPTRNAAWQTQDLVVAIGEPGPLYILQREIAPLTGTRILTSNDFGKTWHPFTEVLPVVSGCLHNMNLDYATAGVLYLSSCQGLYRWSGEAWDLISAQETGSVMIVYGQPESIWATHPFGPVEVPVIHSNNKGVTWGSASRYLGHSNGVASLAFDVQNPQILYATIWPDYAGSYLKRGTSNGQWEDLPTPANAAPLSPGFALDGNNGALYVISNPRGSQLWRTAHPAVPEANTIQWELIRDFGDWVRVELLASGWGPDGLALYANLTDISQNDSQPVLHRSLDGGKSWASLEIKIGR